MDSPERYGLFQNKKYIRTDEFAEEYDAEAEAIQAEVKRLIYVAATRARNALIISRSGWFDLRNKEHRPVPRWDVLLADPVCDPERFHLVCPEDLPRVSEETRKIRASELYEKARHEGVLRDRSAEQPGFSVHTPSSETEEKVPSRLEEDSDAYDRFSIEETENVTEEKVLVHHYPAVFGTMIHRMMELLVLSRGKMTDPERMLKGIFAAYATPEIAEYEADFLDAMRRALEQLQSGGYPQQNGVPTDILHTLYAADEVYCEVPFSYRIPGAESDELWYGIMDVVYRTGDTWHIVDYKTNADGGDLDTEYHAQMQAYSRSFATITGHVAEAHTYHIKV